MEVYLLPDESELFKYVCLDQKVFIPNYEGCASLYLWTAPAPAALFLPACCHFVLRALLPFRSSPALVSFWGCLLCFLWLELKAMNLPSTDLMQTFETNGNLLFLWLHLVIYHPHPACHPSREVEVVSGFLPSDSPVNAEWLWHPFSSCVFGLPNFCMTLFCRTSVSPSKET